MDSLSLWSASERIATYHDANKVQFLQLVVDPSLGQTISFFFRILIEQSEDWVISRGRLEQGGHVVPRSRQMERCDV